MKFTLSYLNGSSVEVEVDDVELGAFLDNKARRNAEAELSKTAQVRGRVVKVETV